MLAIAIHEILSGKRTIAPGSAVDLPDDTFADLQKLGAVRPATAAETQLHGRVEAAKGASNETGDDRQALEQKAASLGLKFRKNTADEKLAEMIAEAESASAGSADSDVSQPLV